MIANDSKVGKRQVENLMHQKLVVFEDGADDIGAAECGVVWKESPSLEAARGLALCDIKKGMTESKSCTSAFPRVSFDLTG